MCSASGAGDGPGAELGGVITDSYAYDAFGSLTVREGTTHNPFLFTGQQFDDRLDAYHLRARIYDPSLGRFTSRDPFAGVQAHPLTLNPYLYARNDPVNLVDPSGQWPSLAGIQVAMLHTYARFVYWASPALYLMNRIVMRLGTSSIASAVQRSAHAFTSGVYRIGGLHPRLLNLHAGQVFEKLLRPAMRLIGAQPQVRIQGGRAVVDWVTRNGTLVDAKLGGAFRMAQLRHFVTEAATRSGRIVYITLRAPPPSVKQAMIQEASRSGVIVQYYTLFPF